MRSTREGDDLLRAWVSERKGAGGGAMLLVPVNFSAANLSSSSWTRLDSDSDFFFFFLPGILKMRGQA